MDATQLGVLAASLLHGLSDPTVLMSLIVASSLLGSLAGKIPWKYTGIILILGALYAKLAEIFGPEAAAALIASNIASFAIGRLVSGLRQKFFEAIDE